MLFAKGFCPRAEKVPRRPEGREEVQRGAAAADHGGHRGAGAEGGDVRAAREVGGRVDDDGVHDAERPRLERAAEGHDAGAGRPAEVLQVDEPLPVLPRRCGCHFEARRTSAVEVLRPALQDDGVEGAAGGLRVQFAVAGGHRCGHAGSARASSGARAWWCRWLSRRRVGVRVGSSVQQSIPQEWRIMLACGNILPQAKTPARASALSTSTARAAASGPCTAASAEPLVTAAVNANSAKWKTSHSITAPPTKAREAGAP
mmetsp:Transcript_2670/g.9778  ORF Transcript_2670/g.9778 Transcript_2670/m.9778 type:complete len:259 (-) Transcript_2670:32-808(-)